MAMQAAVVSGVANLIGSKMAATSAGKAANKANAQAEARTNQIMGFVQPAYEKSMAAQQQQYQQAVALRGQTLRPTIDAMRGGNVAAQQTLIDSLPMQRAALLGGRVNYGAMKPYSAPVDEAALQGLFNPQSMQYGQQTMQQQPMQSQGQQSLPPGVQPLTPAQMAYYGIGG
jgi:hypothetical protein